MYFNYTIYCAVINPSVRNNRLALL